MPYRDLTRRTLSETLVECARRLTLLERRVTWQAPVQLDTDASTLITVWTGPVFGHYAGEATPVTLTLDAGVWIVVASTSVRFSLPGAGIVDAQGNWTLSGGGLSATQVFTVRHGTPDPISAKVAVAGRAVLATSGQVAATIFGDAFESTGTMTITNSTLIAVPE